MRFVTLFALVFALLAGMAFSYTWNWTGNQSNNTNGTWNGTNWTKNFDVAYKPVTGNNTTNQSNYSIIGYASPSQGGWVAGSAYNLPYGVWRTLYATPNNGYYLAGWQNVLGNCPTRYPKYANSIQVQAAPQYGTECRIAAIFNYSNQSNGTNWTKELEVSAKAWNGSNQTNNTSNAYRLLAQASPWNGGATAGSTAGVPYGELRNVIAYPAPGYYFSMWTSGQGGCEIFNASSALAAVRVAPAYGDVCVVYANFNLSNQSNYTNITQQDYTWNWTNRSKNWTNYTNQTQISVPKKACPLYAIVQDDGCTPGSAWRNSDGCYVECRARAEAPSAEKATPPDSESVASESAGGSGGGSVGSTVGGGVSDGGAASIGAAGAFVDFGGDTYAKLMNILGIYVEKYKQ